MGFFSRLFNLDKLQATPSLAADLGAASTDMGLGADAADAILAGIDIDAAIAAHENWKARLEEVVNGTSSEQLHPELVCLDDQCTLGKWLHGAGGQQLGKYPAFQVLVSRHQYFHAQAGEVLSQAQSGAADDARKTLQGSYRYASNQVVLLLKELKRSLGRS